jgi:hypothetical protein
MSLSGIRRTAAGFSAAPARAGESRAAMSSAAKVLRVISVYLSLTSPRIEKAGNLVK